MGESVDADKCETVLIVDDQPNEADLYSEFLADYRR